MDKKKNRVLIIFIFFTLSFGGGIFCFNKEVFAAGFAGIQTTVKIAICGNNIKETGEQCDNADLGGASCSSQGFSGGTLSCGISCDFDTSACSSGGGSGGGAGGAPITPIPAVIQINRCSNLSKSSDINNNGSVDIFDFNLLMVKWGSVGQSIAADINCDGSIDIFDFNLLMVNWGKTFQ